MTHSSEAPTEQSPWVARAGRLRAQARRRLTRSTSTALGAVAAVAVVAAACSSTPANSASSSSTSNANGSGSGAGSGNSTATVKTAQNSNFGTILVTSDGKALYTFGADHGGQSACSGPCAAAWPALTVASGATPTAGPGVTGTLGTSAQSNGTVQVTYNGALLYTFANDQTPGQVNGNNVANFSVVKVSSSSSGSGAGGGSGTTTTRGGSGY